MLQNMTDEEKEILQKIYEPTVVTIPPSDACRSMCVSEDGEIRIYGKVNKKHPEDWGEYVYIASRDGGLTWKTRLVKNREVLGCAGYRAETGRYISTYPNEFRPELRTIVGKSGTWAVLNDEGFDSVNNRYVQISDLEFHILRNAVYYDSCKRWFVLGEYNEENHVKHPVICYSQDDGENWTVRILEQTAPVYEGDVFDQGPRWQQYSCEPTLVENMPGELLLLVRTSHNYHYQYVSHDYGDTWEGPVPSAFHGTITMPVLHQMEDGRVVFFWCNNEPMPELDHQKTWPKLSEDEKQGVWEDVFTNRDANHLAVSENGGKSWIGMRELFLNAIRNHADFRSIGGLDSRDKSVHQAEIIELPYQKLLIHFGQNQSARKVLIVDVNWLYEKERRENFRFGLDNVTTHMFVKSNLGGYRTFSGHCAYNRTNGALLVPDPAGNFEEVLQICRVEDERLVYKKQGVVWNFPAAAEGTVTVKLRVLKSGVAISLCDHWHNACDETVKYKAPVTFEVKKEMCSSDDWTTVSMKYTLCGNEKGTVEKAGTAEICVNDKRMETIEIQGSWPIGLSYLHIQTLAEVQDLEGTLIKEFSKK